jgi:glycosyltransferase involved in cell wall biosynthesis
LKICLLTEGSYPYVVGGVSSWVQMLIEGMPEHEFIVYAIGAEQKSRGKFRYELPVNLIEIKEVFLDEILDMKSLHMRRSMLTEVEKACLYELILGSKDMDMEALIGIFHSEGKIRNALDIFMSSDFFDIIEAVYKDRYNYLPFTDFFWTMRSMLLPLFYLLQQQLPEADVYHSIATGYCGVIGSVASTVYKKPFIITEHGIYSREREAEIIRCQWAKGDFKSIWIQYFYNLAKVSYQSANRVFTLFDKNAQTEKELGCAAEKIAIVPNGIHMERFADVPLLEEHSGAVVLGAVVRVVPIKDIVTLLRAFFLVQQVLPEASLQIMGQYEEDPEYYDLCRQTIETLRLNHVEFTGSVDVAKHLKDIDILLLSSISEGQPLAVLEGFAAHRPFVTTDVGCCRELVYGEGQDTLGLAGAVVAPMDYEAMAQAVLRLAADAKLRREMGIIGYERVKRKYTYEKFISAYQQIYERELKVKQ